MGLGRANPFLTRLRAEGGVLEADPCTINGLSGAVASASEERALAVARRVRSGTMSVNGGSWFHVDSPFGSYKQSGVGRENGLAGFEEYLETKVIALPRRKT